MTALPGPHARLLAGRVAPPWQLGPKSAPRTRRVEQNRTAPPPGAVPVPSAGSPALLSADAPHPLGTVDPWRDTCHYGSPDLVEFPPSVVENFYASQVLHRPDDTAARAHLLTVAQSELRVAAVVRLVRKVRDAQRLLGRVEP